MIVVIRVNEVIWVIKVIEVIWVANFCSMSGISYSGGFRELEVGKEARKFRNTMSSLTRKFPASEKYKLTDQLLRASRSVTACIAEGYGRYHFQENVQFCRQSRGSLMECLDHLTVALDEQYIDQTRFEEYESQYQTILKLLNGYISFLTKRKQQQ